MKIIFDPKQDTKDEIQKVVDFWYGNPSTNQAKLSNPAKCEDCGQDVEQKVVNFCNIKYPGHVYCRDCQLKHKEA